MIAFECQPAGDWAGLVSLRPGGRHSNVLDVKVRAGA